MVYVTTVIIGLLTFYFLCVFPTQWLKIERVRHPLGLNLNILQISDLHVERLRVTPEQINLLIKQENPDLIVITGDFTEREDALPRVEQYLSVFRAAERPVYAVLGNHDYKLEDPEGLVARIERYGIKVLRNESVHLQDFMLIGIDDHYTQHSYVDKAFAHMDDGFRKENTLPQDDAVPKIVITHDPNVVLAIDHRFDYLMAGHLHGKQFNVPFLFVLKPMGELPRRGIYKGLHESEHGTYYISKGIGQTGVNARLLVRSEVTVHEL